MTTYELADKALEPVARPIIEKYHSHLSEHAVKVDYLWARAEIDEKTGLRKGVALKVRGHRVLGKARITSLKERAAGRGDAEVIVDADWWDEAPERQQKGLLDHELTHLDMGEGRDDLNRPKLKIRYHDHEFGGFTNVALRWGQDSPECINARTMWDTAQQAYWPDLIVDMPEAREEAGVAA